MHISVVLHGEPGKKKNEQKEEIKLKTKSMVSPRKHSRFTAGPGLNSGQSIDWRPTEGLLHSRHNQPFLGKPHLILNQNSLGQ